jgi:ATP-dependent DNA helicase DinG
VKEDGDYEGERDFGFLKDKEKEEAKLLEKRVRRIHELIDQLAEVEHLEDSSIYCIEEDRSGGVQVVSKPGNVADRMRKHLFERGSSTIVTSATLAVGGSFDFVASEIGASASPPVKTLVAPSPFRWGDQVLLVLPDDMPDPKEYLAFREVVAERCAQTIREARGRTLALFTSWESMRVAHRRAVDARLGYRLLVQGEMPVPHLLSIFREDIHSVLFGVATFWAGVDVQGEALSCVFIDRLPFTPKDDPLLDWRQCREAQATFNKYQLPETIIAFKQGFGRLIRHTTDRGVVVCTDRRLSGQHAIILNSLPSVARSTKIADIRPFLDRVVLRLVPR